MVLMLVLVLVVLLLPMLAAAHVVRMKIDFHVCVPVTSIHKTNGGDQTTTDEFPVNPASESNL